MAKARDTGGKLFDASKFRLHRIRRASRDEIEIELGLTSYKDYVGTNLRCEADRAALEADGLDVLGDPSAHLSNALGCEAMLITLDGLAVLLRRSGAVATGSGLYNGPSGHAEPSHAGIYSHQDGDMSPDAVDGRAADELFGAILQEVHEETNIPLHSLSEPRLLGAMEDTKRKPDVLFCIDCKLDARGVREAYAQGAAEGWESDRLAFWPASTLAECRELPLTCVTRACAALYGQAFAEL